ncbi:MAG: hypothetical protein QOI34_768 [Verrucomicrobiota bacterium]
MARPRRTQKEVAERYAGNLGYYARIHLWRGARRLVTLLTIVAALIAFWAFSKFGRETFLNPGPISRPHTAFADQCEACHDKSLISGGLLTSHQFKTVLKERLRHGVAFEPIDRKCETCHRRHSFHEANVVQNRSCSACHQEHQGRGPMKLVASANCTSCHGNPAHMSAAAEKGMHLPGAAFYRHPHSQQQVVFELPRPASGFTQVFQSFAADHPEFQLTTAKARDPDVLRFNHQRHLASDIPAVNGHKLDCNYCHQPQPNGDYYDRISFANHCQTCHSLQFDFKNPELKIPHGDVQLVRTFLRTLPAQYADYARLRKGKTNDREVQSFVAEQIRQLRENFRSGTELEQAVFFTTNPYKPQTQMSPGVRANFSGCALCHEVKATANTAPSIIRPILVDRWMSRANFDHKKHVSVQCDDCHHAGQSRETSDVLMPVKANCVTCHSPAGKVASECITCHTFHAPPAAQPVLANAEPSRPRSVKEMLLGGTKVRPIAGPLGISNVE